MSLLVIGLGNPGSEYSSNRHNIGFHVADRIARGTETRIKKPLFRSFLLGKNNLPGGTLFIAKPLTYMNRSGDVVPVLLRLCNVGTSQMLVVCDHLDLPPGVCRLKRKGSSAGHNGLNSIIDTLGTGEFMRLYVGIGRPKPGGTVVDHVLSDPIGEEADLLENTVKRAAAAAVRLLSEPVESVMNDLNRNDGLPDDS